MTFEISVGISFFSFLLFPEHGDIQNVSYPAHSHRLVSRWKNFSKAAVDGVVQRFSLVSTYRAYI